MEAMTAIRAEIARVQDGHWSLADNPGPCAAHPGRRDGCRGNRGYSRAEAVFPSDAVRASKLWPVVG